MIYKRFTSGSIASCTYILGDEETKEAVMIDPGYTQKEADVFIEEEGLTLLHIIDTHGHADHVHNNGYFKEKYGADIMIHKLDAPSLTDQTTNLSEYLGYSLDGPPADVFIEEGDVIQFGSEELTVIHTPGHTPGSISLKRGKALFVGDLVFNGSVGRTDLTGGSSEQLMKTLKDKILTLPDETIIYSGHGYYDTTIGEQKKVNPFFQELMGGSNE
ncbi:MBL fold metallo-hydrolase [Clostridia bacterium]|nr:MBL fold metallo-hydrolase [Clostridia bacterium]